MVWRAYGFGGRMGLRDDMDTSGIRLLRLHGLWSDIGGQRMRLLRVHDWFSHTVGSWDSVLILRL